MAPVVRLTISRVVRAVALSLALVPGVFLLAVAIILRDTFRSHSK